MVDFPVRYFDITRPGREKSWWAFPIIFPARGADACDACLLPHHSGGVTACGVDVMYDI